MVTPESLEEKYPDHCRYKRPHDGDEGYIEMTEFGLFGYITFSLSTGLWATGQFWSVQGYKPKLSEAIYAAEFFFGSCPIFIKEDREIVDIIEV